MQGYMSVIDPDGSQTVREYRGLIPLADLKAGVGDGYIEHVPYFNTYHRAGMTVSCVAFCNELGKLHGLPFNETATAAWHAAAPHMRGRDHLVGPIVLVWGDDAFMRAL